MGLKQKYSICVSYAQLITYFRSFIFCQSYRNTKKLGKRDEKLITHWIHQLIPKLRILNNP